MDADGNELECRVCRSGAEDDRQLFFPCMCSGSIGAVHQDCLEAWLNHSKKDTCELCATKYRFEPHYADGTPTVIPIGVFTKSVLKLSIFRVFPAIMRILFAFLIWVLIVPILTSTIYCMCVGRPISLAFSDWNVVRAQIVHGFTIDAVIALSLLILISFTDFLRFHLVPAQGGPGAVPVAGEAGVGPAAEAAPVQAAPPQQPAPQQNAPAMQPMAVPAQNHQQGIAVQGERRRLSAMTNHRPRRIRNAQRQYRPAADNSFGQALSPRRGGRDMTAEARSSGIYSRADNPRYQAHPAELPVVSPAGTHVHSSFAPPHSPMRVAEEMDAWTRTMSEDSNEEEDFLQPASSGAYRRHTRSSTRTPLHTSYADEEENQAVREWGYSRHGAGAEGEEEYGRYVQHRREDDWHVEGEGEDAFEGAISETENEDEYEEEEWEDDEGGEEDWREQDEQHLRELHQQQQQQEGFNFNFNIPDHQHQHQDHPAPAPHNNNNNAQDLLPQQDHLFHENIQENLQNEEENMQENLPNEEFENLDLNDNLEGLQEANVEVRLAIFEILGVEGPFHLMFRNSFWLLGFCALYLFFTAMVPYMIGSMLAKLSVVYLSGAAVHVVPAQVKSMYELIVLHSTNTVPLQFLDFFYIFGGCCGIFTAVFVLDCAAYVLLQIKTPPAPLKVVLELVDKLAVVIKVGCLLGVRIFLLPLCLGTAVLVVSSHALLPFTAEQWARFIALHCLGAFAVAWVAGITFMLTMTISVLQLREVLHPALLGKIIRPQEPHVELINSLIQESGLVHLRRIFISLFVYLLLMLLLLYVPMLQYTALCKIASTAHHFDFVYWYVIPEIQIPLELMVSHLTFLSMLDKHKDVIGRCQHVVLVWLCDKLGLTRFALPCPQMALRRQANAAPANAVDRLATIDAALNPVVGAEAGGGAQAAGAGVEIKVGPPLRRPPPGWDIRTPNQSTRWAWSTEEPSATERSVAPRLTPSWWLLRVAVLVAACFLILNCITLFFLLVPLQLGRALSALVYVPQVLKHDPLHFVVGCIACMVGANMLIHRLPRWEKVKEVAGAVKTLPLGVVYQVLLVCLHLAAAHVLLAVVLHTLVCTPSLAHIARATVNSVAGRAGRSAMTSVLGGVIGGVSGVGADITIAADAAIAAGSAAVNNSAVVVLDAAYLHSLVTSLSSALRSSLPAMLQALAVSVLVSFTARQILTSNSVIAYLEILATEQPDSALADLYRWAAALKQIPFEIALALHGRLYTVDSLKLRQLQTVLLRPLIVELLVQCILLSVVIAMGLCYFDRGLVVNTQFLYSEFQIGVYLYVLRQMCVLLYHPLCGVLRGVHKQVLNDNYLIGRTLVNNNVAQARDAAAATASTAAALDEPGLAGH